jgi:hypothetical protein
MKLPIGIQSFEEIRIQGYIYVDKTENIHRLVSTGKYYTLSRPRRFGKSLLLSTMRAMYEGKKHLFQGLWIENHWNWERIFPVIHVKFARFKYQNNQLSQAIEDGILLEAQRLGIDLNGHLYKSFLEELIVKAAAQSPTQKVVILIDEYDKPIIDFLDEVGQAAINRQILKDFYSVIKDNDQHIELLFITGVSRFAKTSIFSDLNNLINLTLDFEALNLLGITQEEIAHYFNQQLETIAKNRKESLEDLLKMMQSWYNGYSWDGEHKVYNPFSLLSFIRSGKFDNYWFETGTPTFLVKKMRDLGQFNIEKIRASSSLLDSYDLENLNPITVLFQTGYLTIQQVYRQDIYELNYPNQEVKSSFEEKLLDAYAFNQFEAGKTRAIGLVEALEQGDLPHFMRIVNATFGSIPAELWQKENEAFYHALIHLLCSLMGAYIQSEVNSSNGRLDAKVETEDSIYIFEFKLDRSAEEALQQIGDKGYFQPFLDSPKKRIGVGVNFSKTKKEVQAWLAADF